MACSPCLKPAVWGGARVRSRGWVPEGTVVVQGRRDKALEEEYGSASKTYVDAAAAAHQHTTPSGREGARASTQAGSMLLPRGIAQAAAAYLCVLQDPCMYLSVVCVCTWCTRTLVCAGVGVWIPAALASLLICLTFSVMSLYALVTCRRGCTQRQIRV